MHRRPLLQSIKATLSLLCCGQYVCGSFPGPVFLCRAQLQESILPPVNSWVLSPPGSLPACAVLVIFLGSFFYYYYYKRRWLELGSWIWAQPVIADVSCMKAIHQAAACVGAELSPQPRKICVLLIQGPHRNESVDPTCLVGNYQV